MSELNQDMIDKLFYMLDANSDGFLTKTELETGLKGIGHKGDTDHFMKEMDFNSDGLISREECRKYLQGKSTL